MKHESTTYQHMTGRSVADRVTDLRRTDAGDRLYFRTSRIVPRHDGVFVRTREGVELGPFDSVFAAEVEAALLVNALTRLAPGVDPSVGVQTFVRNEYEQPEALTAG
jgi:hypothetical protein